MTAANQRQKADPKKFVVGRPYPPSLAEVADDETLGLVFKALDNEVRRGILGAVHDSPRGLRSSFIAERFDIPWQGVSRHLRILTEAGLLRCEVMTNGRLYFVEPDRLRLAARWMRRVATPSIPTRDGKVTHQYED